MKCFSSADTNASLSLIACRIDLRCRYMAVARDATGRDQYAPFSHFCADRPSLSVLRVAYSASLSLSRRPRGRGTRSVPRSAADSQRR
ncbi:unnamed protein product, partial [Brenthis ino]